MAIVSQVINPTERQWQALEKAAGDQEIMEEHRARHEKGAAVVLELSGAVQAVVMLWAEKRNDGGREIVCGLGTGKNAKGFVPWLKAFAGANNAQSVRTHCQRSGLARIYEKQGFERAGLDSEGLHVMRWNDGR